MVCVQPVQCRPCMPLGKHPLMNHTEHRALPRFQQMQPGCPPAAALLKGVSAEQHGVQHDPRAPDVGPLGIIGAGVGEEHLRRCSRQERVVAARGCSLGTAAGSTGAQAHPRCSRSQGIAAASGVCACSTGSCGKQTEQHAAAPSAYAAGLGCGTSFSRLVSDPAPAEWRESILPHPLGLVPPVCPEARRVPDPSCSPRHLLERRQTLCGLDRFPVPQLGCPKHAACTSRMCTRGADLVLSMMNAASLSCSRSPVPPGVPTAL